MNNEEIKQQEDWLYSEIVKDHFFNPRNYLAEEKYEADGFGTAGSPVCGDLMKVWIKVDSEKNKIIECKWQTFGCASAIASTSMMSVMVTENGGMILEEAKKLSAEKIMTRLGGLPDNKIHCSVLGHLALRNAIDDYQKKQDILKGAENIFILKNKIEENSGVSTLEFIPAEKEVFDFKAGQFALFQILNEKFSGSHGKAYTIINLPGENFLAITVKRAGEFSNALCDLKIGDKVKITGPFGNFYPAELNTNDIVFLAGGICITPFYAIIKDFYKRKINKKVTLIYSNRNKEDIIFLKELREISEKWENLKIVYILTREKEKISHIDEYERMNIKIIKKYLGDLSKKDYFIGGRLDFVADIKEQLKNAAVEPGRIKIEAF